MFDIYNLFESVGIIVDSKLSQLALDRTIECQVIDIASLSNGYCTVQYGDITLTANCTNIQPKLGDIVYVGVPQTDYSNAYIIAKKATGMINDSKIIQIDPFKNFVPCFSTSAMAPESEDLYVSSQKFDYLNLNKYTQLGISCKVYSQIKHSCAYGIKLYICTKTTVGDNEIVQLGSIIDFDISKKLGIQAQDTGTSIVVKDLFSIADLDNLAYIQAEFYSSDLDASALQELQISDFTLSFGNLISDYAAPGIVLYSENRPEYSSTIDRTLNYPLYAKLIYEDEQGLHVITPFTNTPIPDNISIKWDNELAEPTSLIALIPQSTFKNYKNSYTAAIDMTYNSIFSNSTEDYSATYIIKNTDEQSERSYFSTSEKIELTAKRTDFKNIYNPDGTIVNFMATTNPAEYQLYFTTKNPLNQKGLNLINNNAAVVCDLRLSLPNTVNTNIGFSQYNQYGFELEDINSAHPHVYKKRLNTLPDTLHQDAQYFYNALMPFNLAEYFVPGNNNYIACTLSIVETGLEEEVIAEKTYYVNLDCARSGVCKTDYILIAKMTDENGLPTSYLKAAADAYVNIEFSLYNSQGTQLEILKRIDTSWLGRTGDEQLNNIIEKTYINNYTIRLTNKSNLCDSDLTYNLVLSAVYEMQKEGVNTASRTVCYKPIAINNSYIEGFGEYFLKYFTGPISIVYDSSGGSPNYFDTGYGVYDFQQNKQNAYEFTIQSYGPSTANASYYPKLITVNGETKITVPTMLMKNTEASTVIFVRDVVYDKIMWIQPIVLWQIKSFSSYINDWDGRTIQIDKDKMMTPFLGAGRVDEHGFSGVALGDASNVIEDGSAPLAGIYGYGQGEQSFGFKEDGTAFIGKVGEGRIEFDGSRGTIKSANFNGVVENGVIKDLGTLGSYWDLKDGKIITNDGYFRGKIDANEGNIANWSITHQGLESDNLSLLSTSDRYIPAFPIAPSSTYPVSLYSAIQDEQSFYYPSKDLNDNKWKTLLSNTNTIKSAIQLYGLVDSTSSSTQFAGLYDKGIGTEDFPFILKMEYLPKTLDFRWIQETGSSGEYYFMIYGDNDHVCFAVEDGEISELNSQKCSYIQVSQSDTSNTYKNIMKTTSPLARNDSINFKVTVHKSKHEESVESQKTLYFLSHKAPSDIEQFYIYPETVLTNSLINIEFTRDDYLNKTIPATIILQEQVCNQVTKSCDRQQNLTKHTDGVDIPLTIELNASNIGWFTNNQAQTITVSCLTDYYRQTPIEQDFPMLQHDPQNNDWNINPVTKGIYFDPVIARNGKYYFTMHIWIGRKTLETSLTYNNDYAGYITGISGLKFYLKLAEVTKETDRPTFGLTANGVIMARQGFSTYGNDTEELGGLITGTAMTNSEIFSRLAANVPTVRDSDSVKVSLYRLSWSESSGIKPMIEAVYNKTSINQLTAILTTSKLYIKDSLLEPSSTAYEGKTGWFTSDYCWYLYFKAGICVGSISYLGEVDQETGFKKFKNDDICDITKKKPSDYDGKTGEQTRQFIR